MKKLILLSVLFVCSISIYSQGEWHYGQLKPGEILPLVQIGKGFPYTLVYEIQIFSGGKTLEIIQSGNELSEVSGYDLVATIFQTNGYEEVRIKNNSNEFNVFRYKFLGFGK